MDNTDAIDALLAVLDLKPENKKTRILVASLYIESENIVSAREVLGFLGAEELLSEAQKVATSNSILSLACLDTCLQKDKANAQAYICKSQIYNHLGDEENARKFYSIASVIDESLEDDGYENSLMKKSEIEEKEELVTEVEEEERQPLAHSVNEAAVSLEEDFEGEYDEDDAAIDMLLERNMISFTDVGGMEELKDRIRMSIVYPFTKPGLFAKYKKRTGGGILLYGPPGCGKTLISKATAGECGSHFINISIHDILSKWIGEAEGRVHEVFQIARRKAPTIIFIDEVDALCVKRGEAGNSASLVNALLTEIDGAASDNEKVLVIGATNTPWRIDSAFRRPGRFDHVLFVPPPDLEARESVLKLALHEIPQDKINFTKLAERMERFSGADIAAVVELATDVVVQKMMKTGKEEKVTEKLLLQTIKKHRPTTLEWLEQASNYASYANQSGLYDELSDYLGKK